MTTPVIFSTKLERSWLLVMRVKLRNVSTFTSWRHSKASYMNILILPSPSYQCPYTLDPGCLFAVTEAGETDLYEVLNYEPKVEHPLGFNTGLKMARYSIFIGDSIGKRFNLEKFMEAAGHRNIFHTRSPPTFLLLYDEYDESVAFSNGVHFDLCSYCVDNKVRIEHFDCPRTTQLFPIPKHSCFDPIKEVSRAIPRQQSRDGFKNNILVHVERHQAQVFFQDERQSPFHRHRPAPLLSTTIRSLLSTVNVTWANLYQHQNEDVDDIFLRALYVRNILEYATMKDNTKINEGLGTGSEWTPTGKTFTKFITADRVHQVKTSFEIYVLPFTVQTWMTLLGVVLGTAAFLTAVLIIKGYTLKGDHGQENRDWDVGGSEMKKCISVFPETIYWIFRILIEQCEGDTPTVSSTSLKMDLVGVSKIILGFWLLMGVIITNGKETCTFYLFCHCKTSDSL